MIEFLLISGANPNLANNKGVTPLAIITYEYHGEDNSEIVKILLKFGADPNIVNNHGIGPVYYATKMYRLNMIEILVNHGAKFNYWSDERISKEMKEYVSNLLANSSLKSCVLRSLDHSFSRENLPESFF